MLPARPLRPPVTAPRQRRAATMFQRKRSVSFGGYGWWVAFASVPACPWLSFLLWELTVQPDRCRECRDAGEGALLPLLLCGAPVAQRLWGTLWLSAPCSLHGDCPGGDARSSLGSTWDAPTWLGALDASLIPPCTPCPCTEHCGCHPCADLSGMLYFLCPFSKSCVDL